MTTPKKDEKRTSKKSKNTDQKISSRKTARQVPSKSNGTKVRTEKPRDDPSIRAGNGDAQEDVKEAGASGKFERKSFRRKIGSLIRGSAAELPAVINRSLQPIRRSFSFSKDLNRLHEPSKPRKANSVHWYNSLVSLAEDECLDEQDHSPPGNSVAEELFSPKVQVTRTQSLIDTTFTRSPRRRVNEALNRTAPYGRHSDHYDSTIDLSNPPCEASSLPALARIATDESYIEPRSPRERQQQVSSEWTNLKAIDRNLSLLYVNQSLAKLHSV
ncbi:hypothetical protein K0M31_018602, partial [Melipona bicolor]